MSRYESLLKRLSGSTGSGLEKLLTAYEAGDIDRDLFKGATVDSINKGRARGARIGVDVLREYLEEATGSAIVLDPAAPASATDRLTDALETILRNEDLETLMQVRRLADAEIATAARESYGDTMRKTKLVKGWVRGLDSKACQLCQWWWREGRVWAPEHRMPTHTGCLCHQVPVIKKTANYQESRNVITA